MPSIVESSIFVVVCHRHRGCAKYSKVGAVVDGTHRSYINVECSNKAVTVNSLGACVRGPSESGGQNMSDGPKKSSDKGEKSEKPEKSDKGAPSLSIDRAAFLILRVKRAFKKKRQQRKDRQ